MNVLLNMMKSKKYFVSKEYKSLINRLSQLNLEVNNSEVELRKDIEKIRDICIDIENNINLVLMDTNNIIGTAEISIDINHSPYSLNIDNNSYRLTRDNNARSFPYLSVNY